MKRMNVLSGRGPEWLGEITGKAEWYEDQSPELEKLLTDLKIDTEGFYHCLSEPTPDVNTESGKARQLEMMNGWLREASRGCDGEEGFLVAHDVKESNTCTDGFAWKFTLIQ